LAQGGWDEAALALASVDFPRLPARGGSDPVLREEARKARDAAKEIVNDLNKGLFGRSLASYHEDLSRLEPVVTGLCRLVRAYGQRYQRRKDEAGGVDFADLERLALKALTHSSGRALAECRRRFVEVLVDEYQDINPVQDRSEEHTSELQSRENLVCRLLLEKKKKKKYVQTNRVDNIEMIQ